MTKDLTEERRRMAKLPLIIFLCLLFPTTVLSLQQYAATVNMTVGLFFDNFNEHTPPEAPDRWTVYSGTWQTATDGTTVYAQTQKNVDRTVSMAGDTNWTDYVFQVKVKFVFPPGTPPGTGAILFFRFQDTSNYYFLAMAEDKDELLLYRRIGDVEEQIGLPASITLVENQWYDVRISIEGQIINVRIDDVQYFTNQESGGTLTTGAIGVGTKRYSCSFDDVNVNSIPS
ncbi:DUF1080 domain-containing protein [Candidatus Bathyarchaeota archaeon]|nr:DUF1080 domain-containing protein [Candidatus Bathyarchaeota archaeon]